jgi:sodium transport system permease protein
VGAYARSSKEGQYYLMPLFLVTMPLIFLTLAPGVDLNPFYSMVPVTGVALLMQKLITAGSMDRIPWLYFIPVLGPLALYGWFALRWAIEQFNREEVLFREAERLDVKLWFQRLLRDKEALPNTGEALACFALIVFLRWMAFGVGGNLSHLARTGIELVAFVAAPPVLMAMLLTTRPTVGLALRLPTLRQAVVGVLLAMLLAPSLAEVTGAVLRHFPGIMQLMSEHDPLAQFVGTFHSNARNIIAILPFFLVFVALVPVGEELAFRGFILGGLQHRFTPWKAIVLSAFLFAIYHMNVFQFAPAFLMGVVLGLLAVRSRSIWPGVLLHAVYNGLIIGSPFLESALQELGYSDWKLLQPDWAPWIVCAVCVPPALLILWRIGSRLPANRGELVDAVPTPVSPSLANGVGTPVEVKPLAGERAEKGGPSFIKIENKI